MYVAWDTAINVGGEWVLAYDWSNDNGNHWQDSYFDTDTGKCGLAGDGCGHPLRHSLHDHDVQLTV